MIANEQGMLDLNAKIKTLLNRKIINTTAGRLILKSIIPDYVPESYWNKIMKTERYLSPC